MTKVSEDSDASEENNTLIAYEIYPNSGMHLQAAPIAREWMDATHKRFAYRCLPLTIANQAGWTIASPRSFTAMWNVGERLSAIRRGWQKDYFHGKDPGDIKSFPEHQTKLKIDEFRQD